MNFFEQQDRARKNTWLLIALFSASVLCIIGLTVALIAASFWGFGQSTSVNSASYLQQFDSTTLLKTAAAVIAVIVCVILFKRMQMSRGGPSVAEMLGGRPIDKDTADANEQKLLNVVEEMALAAGLPVPPVYVLEETTINAFAAGFNESDAVIGVTRGTLERLNRDQLQGIVGHEFSHVLHGDMRLNLNLITILAGIVFISKAGRLALHSTSRSRSNNRGGLPVLGIGVGLLIIGSIGTLFGSLIKSAVSRQREYLADASAVQYTRNPDGIAGALKVIGSGVGSSMSSPNANECSHMFFGDAIFLRAFSLMSTHPPLEKRILRIDPRWDGSYLPGKAIEKTPASSTAESKNKIDGLEKLLNTTGFLDPVMVAIAALLVDALPKPVNDATHNPGSAYALMLALRLDKDEKIRQKQLAYIQDHPLLVTDINRYAPDVAKLQQKDILPLIEMSIPALKRLSDIQYSQFKQHLTQFIFADKQSHLQEWLHFRLLSHYLDTHFNGNKKRFVRNYHSFSQIKNEIICAMSLLASESHTNSDQKIAAFSKGMKKLEMTDAQYIIDEELEFHDVNKAIEKIDYLVPLLKDEFLTACAECIEYDNTVTPTEWGLLRVIAACIGCPMPIVNRPD
ncbi:MAG: M48 family metallopeptidase [Gammaproteobacteria bacterium]|nr:M48 family metallopeptidase [Gammaproteobacteria bacterium]